MVEDTDRCGRGGGDGGRAGVSAGRLAVRLCGRVQGHGVLGDPTLPGVVLCRERVWGRKLCGDAILWGRRVLGWGVRLGHGFWGVGGLLVTLRENTQRTLRSKLEQHCLTVRARRVVLQTNAVGGNSHHITSRLRSDGSLISASELLGSMAPCWRGQESGGISTALVAKHKRKDQLIDKSLIRAFDFNDRSAQVAAAASRSYTLILLKLTRVSFNEPLGPRAFVSASFGIHP